MTALDDRVRHEAIERARAASDETGLLLDAAELVIASGLGSRRMIHRKLRIGWDKAGTLLDRLEAAGVIGPDVGDPRDVLVAPEGLDAALEALAAEARPPGLVKPGARSPAGDKAGEEAGDAPADPGDNPGDAPARPGDDPGDRAGAPAGDTRGPHPGDEVSPARPGGTLVKRQVDDVARLIDDPGDDPGDDTSGQPRQLLVARVIAGGAQVVTTLRQSETAVFRVPRSVIRYGYVSGQGVTSWVRRAINAANFGGAREQLRMARAAQPLADPDAAMKWMDFIEKQRDHRINRLKNLPAAIKGVVQAVLGWVVVALFVALLGGGAAWLAWGKTGWDWWWWSLHVVVIFVANLFVICIWLAFLLTPPVTVWAAHREGKRVADPPRWLLSLDERHGLDAEITPHKVAMALRDSGIPALRNYIKEDIDQGGGLLSDIVMEGCGMGVTVRLVSGASTEDIIKKRRRIAENCDRHEHELFITVPRAHHVHLWLADPGALEEPIGPSPLVRDSLAKANFKTGRAPFGQLLRGDPVGVNLHQKMLLITGLSNQGKTFCLRALALWAAFDPKVEFWIADLKGHIDWDPLRELATRFVKGPADQHVIAATEMVEAAVAEMERRLASGKADEFPELIVIVDEAQVAYTSPLIDANGAPYGGQRNNSRYCMAVRRIKNQGRIANVLIWEGTQDPTNTNLPKITREASHIRISLVVGTHQQSRMALGDAAVDGGAAPHMLRKDLDRGMVVMHGGVDMPPGESSITVRTHFIDHPQAWQIAQRATAVRNRRRSPLVIDAGDGGGPDHLMAIYRAMRSEDKVRTAVLLGRLIEEDQDEYEPWGHDDLASVLRRYPGLGIRKSDGQSVVRLNEVEKALRERVDDLP